jgi:serine protease AprX
MRGYLTHRFRSVTSCLALMLTAGAVGVVGPAAAVGYDPATDPNSMQSVTAMTGAQAWWNAGYTGAGVDVAVIDTGVAPVAGLDGLDKVVNGPDLSFESQNPALAYLDTNGHGTFMAGLIAGRDATATKPYASAPATSYRGIAPDARIVTLKVGVADGGVDVTQVIAAINWVVQHRTDTSPSIAAAEAAGRTWTAASSKANLERFVLGRRILAGKS